MNGRKFFSIWAMRLQAIILALTLVFPSLGFADGMVSIKVKYDLITKDYKNLEEPSKVFVFSAQIPAKVKDYKKLIQAAAVDVLGKNPKKVIHKVHKRYDQKLEDLKTQGLSESAMRKAVKKINARMADELNNLYGTLDGTVKKAVTEEVADIVKRKKLRVRKGWQKKIKIVAVTVVGTTVAVAGIVGASVATGGAAAIAAGAVGAAGGGILALTALRDAYKNYKDGPLRRDAGQIDDLLQNALINLKKGDRKSGYSKMKKADREIDRLISAWEKENRELYTSPDAKSAKKKVKALNKIKEEDLTTKDKQKLKKYQKIYDDYKQQVKESTTQVRAAVNFSKSYKGVLEKCKNLGNRVKNKPSKADVEKCARRLDKSNKKYKKVFLSD